MIDKPSSSSLIEFFMELLLSPHFELLLPMVYINLYYLVFGVGRLFFALVLLFQFFEFFFHFSILSIIS